MNDTLSQITQNFRNLIISQCRFCGFDQYLAENPGFEFPEITADLFGADLDRHIAIPGLFGGFNYFLTQVDGKPVLYAEQPSRMDHDSNSYSYFEVTADGSRKLEGEEREDIHRRFLQFMKRAREKHLAATKATKNQS